LRRLPWLAAHLVAILLGRESRFRTPPAGALVWLVAIAATLAIPDAARADVWDGPNHECAPDNTLLGDWGGVRSQLAKYGIGFGLQEQAEVWGNLVGGIKRGATYDGLTTGDLCIDLDKAIQWPGAKIFSYGYQIWGPGPTRNYVGSLQLISSIEATPSTKLKDLWFQQDAFDGKVSFRFGQEGADDEFWVAPYDTLYLNSSFTLPPLIALNLPSGGPAYPLASPFARLMVNPTSEISLMSAVYTEDPAPPGPGDPQERDRHGTAFRFGDHTLSITELSYTPAFLGKLQGIYKVGMWWATGPFADQLHSTNGFSLANPASNGVPVNHQGDYAFYVIANQMLWHKPKGEAQEGIGVFLQVMRGPEDRNINDLWIEVGMNWNGPIPGRSQDQAGIAVTYAGIGSYARQSSRDVVFYSGFGTPFAQGEPIIEATYSASLTPWFKLQPDLQYVINTGAGIPTAQSPTPLKNALVIGMRATVNF
jgi:porin